MNYPIVFETARLRTRPLEMEDQVAWTEFFNSAEATEYFPNPAGLSAEVRAKEWMEKQLGRYADSRYGMMALIDKTTGEWIGQCGLLAQVVDDIEELEVGYHIFPQYWRQGYASEAAQAFRDLGFQTTDRESIISIIHVDNIKSQGVALKNGMKRTKTSTFWTMPVYVYRIMREEWLAS
jgi:[ribosomal protein S5]-alanine N-acetyltransferase